jgi:hypothetical protein
LSILQGLMRRDDDSTFMKRRQRIYHHLAAVFVAEVYSEEITAGIILEFHRSIR